MDWWEAIPGDQGANKRAGRAVDALTFNRIHALGWEGLSPFQRGVVADVMAELVKFQSDNVDLLESTVSGYSINGVSVQYNGGVSVTRVEGVIIPRELYALLEQTGLTCPVLRG